VREKSLAMSAAEHRHVWNLAGWCATPPAYKFDPPCRRQRCFFTSSGIACGNAALPGTERCRRHGARHRVDVEVLLEAALAHALAEPPRAISLPRLIRAPRRTRVFSY
jgi:hypothetical protein